MNKRNLFEELNQSLTEAKDHDQGKMTLRTHNINKSTFKITAKNIKEIREQFNMSRALFATYLHISPRTLEKWEQGVSKPNEQAVTLLKLTEKYPDTLERLQAI